VIGVPTNAVLPRKRFVDMAFDFALPFPFGTLEDPFPFEPVLLAFFFVATGLPPCIETAENGASLLNASAPVKIFPRDGPTLSSHAAPPRAEKATGVVAGCR
jgi:hypothetical protein